MVSRAPVKTWNAHFASIRFLLRVDRVDSIYLGAFASRDDVTRALRLDPVFVPH